MGTDTPQRMSDRTKLPGNASAERPAGRLREFVVRGTELLLAIVLVFVFFLTFLAIIGFSFPQGTSLRDLVYDWRLRREEIHDGVGQTRLQHGQAELRF